MDPMMRMTTVEAFGFRVNCATLQHYLFIIDSLIRKRQYVSIFYHNLHTLYLYFRSASLRRLYREATIVLLDGMPVVWLLQCAGFPVQRVHRVTWVDFIWPLLEHANACQWRVFYLGSTPDVLSTGLDHIRQRLPHLTIAGHHGYYNATPGSADNQRLVRQINDFRADLCLVGMGTPRQERWVAQHRSLLHVPAVLLCGACMEYVAGAVRTPPRLLGRMGMDWSYRLAENPRRFAMRYLVEPWVLAGMLFANTFRKSDRALSPDGLPHAEGKSRSSVSEGRE